MTSVFNLSKEKWEKVLKEEVFKGFFPKDTILIKYDFLESFYVNNMEVYKSLDGKKYAIVLNGYEGRND